MSVVSTICPSIDLNLQHRDVMVTSPQSVTVRQWISTSYSASQASWSMPPPSTSVFIDPCFIKATSFVITVAGTTTGSAMLQAGYDALRAYPIASITNSDQLTLNNAVFVLQTSEFVPYMAHYWEQSKFSSFPSMLDNYQVYADGVGAINNPLGQYFNAVAHHQPRGGYPMVIVNGSTSSTITATVYEPVWIPVLNREFGMGLGFSNVRTCDLVTNYSSSLSRIFSHALSSATITSVSVSLNTAPVIYQLYSSPPAGYVPRALTYGSEDLNRFVTSYGSAVTSNSQVTMTSTNIQLNAIPKSILVFVRESNANLTYASTDTACRIDNISINFNNVSGILSSASSHDLFKISSQNNLQDSWEQWWGITSNLATKIGTSGSFLKLMFGKDITLQQGEFAGKIGAYNLSMNVTFTNVNQSASIANPTLYILTSVPQKMIIGEGGEVRTILGVSGEEGEYVPYNSVMKHYGGSFGDFVRKVGKVLGKTVGFLKDTRLISTLASQIPHPAAQAVASTAKSMGFGDVQGGQVMSQDELRKRVRSFH